MSTKRTGNVSPAATVELDDEAISLEGKERELAKEAIRKLRKSGVKALGGKPSVLSRIAKQVLVKLFEELAQGHSVRLISSESELSTQEAADLLGVSRPFLVKLLEEGKIRFRRVGTHRRVRAQDLLAFKSQNDRERDKALDELVKQAQELKLGYDE